MKRHFATLLSIGLLTAAMPLAIFAIGGNATAAPAPGTVGFGMDSASMGAQSKAGVAPDYATFWIGPWTLSSGWAGPDAELDRMKAAGVTPAIHFYYWGDDISKSCIENGCWSSLHNAQKTKAGWNRLANEMISHLNARMGGKPVLIFVESEFNKGDVSTYEPLDGYLADKARQIKAGYPAAKVVMALGNWNSPAWGTFDRFAAASDYTGIQAMRGSTKDSVAHYDGVYDATLAGAKTLQSKFGKPIVITDIALSSYPDATYAQKQATNLQKFFTGLPALKGAGVQAMIYRSWLDSPRMDLANYYGQAERHWGLATSTALKQSATVWTKGVQAERGSVPSTAPPASGTFTAQFAVSSSSNEWWVEAKVTASAKPSKVEVSANGGAWKAMALKSWGNWAVSTHIAKGTPVTFRATDAYGHQATSQPQPWLGAAAAPAPAPSGFSATFTPKSVGNDWWVETGASGNQGIAKVEAKVGSGAYVVLTKQSWGTYAKSINAPNGSVVTFKATSTTGATATKAVTWP